MAKSFSSLTKRISSTVSTSWFAGVAHAGRSSALLSGIAGQFQAHAAILTALSLVAALAAQYLLDKRQALPVAAWAYALAALLFVLVYARVPLESHGVDGVAGKRPMPWMLVIAAGILGVLAFPRFTGNLFRPDATLLWGAGLVLLAIAARWSGKGGLVSAPRAPSEPAITREGIRVTWAHLALLGIMLIGAFYRLYQLDVLPQEMGTDLPHNYNNIRQILRHEFLIFFPSYPGREGLFYYLAAPVCRLFGLSHLTIKMSGTLVGVFTLPVVYLLGKELFNREVGLFAAFFLSVSHWHIILCRTGYRAATLPLVLALMWYFCIRAFKTNRRWFFALSGFFLGLGLYTYNAFMIVPFLLVAFLITMLLTGRARALLSNWDNVLLLVIVALFVFIPLGRYAYEQPQVYGFRAATRITSLERPIAKDVLSVLVSNTAKALLMFNYQGDGVYAANVPYMRSLGFVTATLSVLGLAYVLWRWRRGHNLTVLATLAIMLLPTILSLAFPNEVPNAIRAIGVLPAAVMLPAVALAAVRGRMAAAFPAHSPRMMRFSLAFDGGSRLDLHWRWGLNWRHVLIVLLVAVLGVETIHLYPVYFRDYAAHLPLHNYSISLEMSRAIDGFADNGQSYIKIMPYWYDGNAVRAQLRRVDQSWNNELNELRPGQPPLAGPSGKFMVIVHPKDEATLRLLRDSFRKGIELSHLDFDKNVAFITFYGER